MSRSSEAGQATVEAAVALPVVFLLILLLCQPIILLYDRLVMENAAAEGCRVLMTSSSETSASEDYIRRRLGSIPPVDIFHRHEDGCSYVIETSGDGGSEEVGVSISNEVRLLPLIAQASDVLGVSNDGFYTIKVTVSMPGRPSWVSGTPDDWAARWE